MDASSSSPRYGYASAEPLLNFVFALTSGFTICVLWIAIYIARSTTHITNSLSDENFCLSLATLVPPLIEKVLAMNTVVSLSMTLWVHLAMQLGCFSADDPNGDPDWWAILLLHVTIEAGIWSTWGGTIPILPGTRTRHWGIHTQLAVHGGLLDAAEVPISIEGKSRLQLLDELSAVALQRANGVRDYGGKNWRFVRAAANNRVHPRADAPSRSVRAAPTRRASSLGLGGRRHETANMLPWF